MADQDQKQVTLGEFNIEAMDEAGITPAQFFALAQACSGNPELKEALDKLTSTISKLKMDLDKAGNDLLTGLPGRKKFIEKVSDTVNQVRRYDGEHAGYDGRHAAIVFLDLDGFKDVNDNCGHAAGDEALKEVAKRIRAAIRSTDVAARWGGDEFVLLLTYAPHEQFDEKAVREKVRTALHGLYYGEPSNPYPIGTSIGIAKINHETLEEGTAEQETLRLVDVADNGENGVYLDKRGKPERLENLRTEIMNKAVANDQDTKPPVIPGPGGT